MNNSSKSSIAKLFKQASEGEYFYGGPPLEDDVLSVVQNNEVRVRVLNDVSAMTSGHHEYILRGYVVYELGGVGIIVKSAGNENELVVYTTEKTSVIHENSYLIVSWEGYTPSVFLLDESYAVGLLPAQWILDYTRLNDMNDSACAWKITEVNEISVDKFEALATQL